MPQAPVAPRSGGTQWPMPAAFGGVAAAGAVAFGGQEAAVSAQSVGRRFTDAGEVGKERELAEEEGFEELWSGGGSSEKHG